MMKWLKSILLALAVIFVLIQFVRPSRTNPPVDPAKKLQAPPEVAAIFDRSCRDCHSNETAWPWYTNVAPVSWILADHVKDGRRELNASEWAAYTPKRKARKLKEICDEVREGEMPLTQYVLLHRDAKLSDADRQTLCTWAQSLSVPPPAGDREESSRTNENEAHRE